MTVSGISIRRLMVEKSEIRSDRNNAIQRAQSELTRCLRLLVAHFPDADFVNTPPALNIIDGYPPLQERITCGNKCHQIDLYTQGHLNRPVTQVLTILLHKTIHVANAFRWKHDCSVSGYHNGTFLDLAKQVGFVIPECHRKTGWADTTPSPTLQVVFDNLGIRPEIMLPFQDRATSWRRLIAWSCGPAVFPDRAELELLYNRTYPESQTLSSSGDQGGKTLGATVNRTWQNAESVPMLRLTGKWLRKLGFHENSRMKIEARHGQLTIQARDL